MRVGDSDVDLMFALARLPVRYQYQSRLVISFGPFCGLVPFKFQPVASFHLILRVTRSRYDAIPFRLVRAKQACLNSI